MFPPQLRTGGPRPPPPQRPRLWPRPGLCCLRAHFGGTRLRLSFFSHHPSLHSREEGGSVFLLRRLVDRSITTDLNLFYWGTRYEGGRKKIKHVAINEKLRAEKDRKKKRSRVTFTQTHSYRRLVVFFCGQRVNGRSEGENLDMSTKFDDSDRRGELKIRQKLFKIECNHLI